MKKQVIMISTDIYPSKTGGLEIFNFHLFRSLKNDSSIDFQFFTTCKKSISTAEILIKSITVYLDYKDLALEVFQVFYQ